MQKIADNYAKVWDYIVHIDSKLELEFKTESQISLDAR